MAQQDVLAVVNADAGAARGPQVDAALAALREGSGRAGARVDLVATTDRRHLAATLAGLAGRRLVVMGGDGSVQAAVQSLHDDDRLRAAGPVGVVPLGTGNDLARSLGLPEDPAEAARTVLTGRARPLALLLADDGMVSVNAVHAGIGVAAAHAAAVVKPALHHVGLGRLAYPAGAVVAGLTRPGWRLRVEVDGAVLPTAGRRLLMVGIGLGRTVGGGAPLVPGADPHDAVIDVMVSGAVGPVARLRFAVQLRSGAHVRRPDVLAVQGREVRIDAAPGRTFRTDSDGEVGGPYASRHWRVEPGAWQVVVPG